MSTFPCFFLQKEGQFKGLRCFVCVIRARMVGKAVNTCLLCTCVFVTLYRINECSMWLNKKRHQSHNSSHKWINSQNAFFALCSLWCWSLFQLMRTIGAQVESWRNRTKVTNRLVIVVSGVFLWRYYKNKKANKK